MKNSLLILLFIPLFTLGQNSKEIVILHTNDMHSRLLPYAPNADYTPNILNDDETIGGFARMSSLFQLEREKNKNTIVVTAGDFLMGTVFQAKEKATGFQLGLMYEMGFDIVGIGNHEFDFGNQGLNEIISNAEKNFESLPLMLLSNIAFNDTLNEDDPLEELFERNAFKKYTVKEIDGLKIGFYSILGYDAEHSAPYLAPATIINPTEQSKKIIQFLKEKEKVDLVICLSHSGVWKDEDGNWTGEDVELATNVPEIDAIISGHSHTKLEKPIVINGTPIVQANANGSNVGKLILHVNDKKEVEFEYNLLEVDDSYPADPKVTAMIEEQKVLVENSLFNGKTKLNDTVVETSFDLTIDEETYLDQSNLGQFVADAIYYYVNQIDKNGADFSLAVAGLIRDDILKGKNGIQTPGDLFRITPLGDGVIEDRPGYPLSKIFISAQEIKSVLEVMLIAPSKGSQNFPFWSGIQYKYNSKRLMLDKVYEVQLKNENNIFEPINLSKKNEKLYSLTANAYLLEFISMINEISMGLLDVQPKFEDGKLVDDYQKTMIVYDSSELKEWEALISYSQSFKDLNNNNIADLPLSYKPENIIDNSIETKGVKGLFKNSNGITKLVYIVIFVLLFLLGSLIRRIAKRRK